VYAFIDMNANAPDNATAMPDSSDFYLQAGQQVTIAGNQTLNLGPSGWITPSSLEFVGTWQASMGEGRGAITLTFTETSFTILAADAPPQAPIWRQTLERSQASTRH
jgi:hypothetical protein